jgi:GTPase SAR1 family protein
VNHTGNKTQHRKYTQHVIARKTSGTEIVELAMAEGEDPEGFCMSPPENENDDDSDDSRPVPKGEPQIPLADSSSISKVSIVLAGKSGAGKTTLMKTLFDVEKDDTKILSADHLTTEHSTSTFSRHGITIEVTDTIGLVEREEERRRELRRLAEHTEGKADVMVYCLSVDPAVKFNYANPGIMRSLQALFGRNIWNRCIIALTFSNNAWDRSKKLMKNKKNDEVVFTYKKHLEEYVSMFSKELEKLGVDATVKPIFGNRHEPTDSSQPTILAIPVGEDPDDEVLPDLRPLKITDLIGHFMGKIFRLSKDDPPAASATPGSKELESLETVPIADWRDVLFMHVVKACKDAQQEHLLRYRYSSWIQRIIHKLLASYRPPSLLNQ